MRGPGLWLSLSLFCISVFSFSTFADEPVAKLRVLSLNIYGKKKKSCKARFRAIAKKIREAKPAYDIISFNEHYNPWVKLHLSCDGNYLTKLIRKDPRYKNKKKSTLYKPRGGFFQGNGANSLFTLHEITERYSKKFRNHRWAIANGYMLNRIKVKEDLEIDFWTAHLESKGPDSCSNKCRKSQADDLADAVLEKNVHNPTIIAGDFNIGGPFNKAYRDAHRNLDAETFPYAGNAGYENLLELLGGSRDTWIEANPDFKGTGYTFDCRENNTTGNCTYRMRVDYVFIPTKVWYQTNDYDLVVDKSEVTKWKTDKGQDVSDHYGYDTTISIYKK